MKATFQWEKDGTTYMVEGFYTPSEPQTKRDPGESSVFEITGITPHRDLSDQDREDIWDEADAVYTNGRLDFWESLMP